LIYVYDDDAFSLPSFSFSGNSLPWDLLRQMMTFPWVELQSLHLRIREQIINIEFLVIVWLAYLLKLAGPHYMLVQRTFLRRLRRVCFSLVHRNDQHEWFWTRPKKKGVC
jgi:hypothetical protein